MKPSGGKLQHLQGLRGIAILAVTLFHFFPDHFGNGYLGVDLFFALSGYLMAMMLSKYSKLGLSAFFDFLYRRVKRIVPLYYLCTLLTLAILNFAPSNLQNTNSKSSAVALVFATNLIRSDVSDGYFERLGEALDMFTHTWSLSLEMQFYLLFPIIFLVFKCLPIRLANGFLALIRMYIYLLVSELQIVGRASSVEDGVREGSFLLPTNLGTYVLLSLAALFVCPAKIDPNFARVLAILLTMHLFQFGPDSLLENRVLVFVGEVSYAWYLVHWPFAAYTKLSEITNPYQIFGVFLLTFMLSVALHLSFEKKYLRWSGSFTFSVLALLLLLNVRELLSLKAAVASGKANDLKLLGGKVIFKSKNEINITTTFHWASDFDVDITYGYENATKEERLKINKAAQATDGDRTSMTKYCKNWLKSNVTGDLRCLFNQDTNKESKLKALVIGNSYAGILMPVIYDECKQHFSQIEISYRIGCEVFARTVPSPYQCEKDYMFLEAVKQVQPDVLFIIARHMKLTQIVNGTGPFNDAIFEAASERLTEIQKHVKKRIYILDDFPENVNAYGKINEALTSGKAPDDNALNGQNMGKIVARMRIQRLAQECPKCKAFDYTPLFFFNGKFKFYDPKYFISYVTVGRHLTPAGLERVRPLIRHLCNSF